MSAEIIPLFPNADQPLELFESWEPGRKVAQAAEQIKAKAPEPRLEWSEPRCPASPSRKGHALGRYGHCRYCHERPRKLKAT